MAREDRRLREAYAAGKVEWETVADGDRRHAARVRELGAEQGLAALLGDDLWLLIQHADEDVALQREALATWKRHMPTSWHVAYLEDRVRLNEGRPQLYGTQIQRCAGHWRPWPIAVADAVELDRRRRAFGLGPFAESFRSLTGRDWDGAGLEQD